MKGKWEDMGFRKDGESPYDYSEGLGNFLYRLSLQKDNIYVFLLCVCAVLLVLSFFIKADIGLRAAGSIKPMGERVYITAPASGRLLMDNRIGGSSVSKGDTLFSVMSEVLNSSKAELIQRKSELDTLISDLEYMTSVSGGLDRSRIQSGIYRTELVYYNSGLSDLDFKYRSAKRSFNRDKVLYEKGLLSQSDYEKSELESRNALMALRMFKTGRRAKWENEKYGYGRELADVAERLDRISAGENESVVCSAVDGSVVRVLNVNDGQYVHQGQSVLEVSPDGELYAECLVPSSGIGLLKIGQKCKIMIDALDYNDWGFIGGCVTEISDDVTEYASVLMYRVYCSLDRKVLTLDNGAGIPLKKGMSLSAFFVVARRPLFHMMFDRVEDWINPQKS